MGKIAKSLIDEGVTLGVSSRGVGSLKEDLHGVKVVGEDFQLATAADIVADPSAPDAFVNGIMEGKEWIWEGGTLHEQFVDETKKRINTLVDQKALEEHKLNLFNNFLLNL
jgi:3-hydroxyisobutyrate dehydrogenase-like beta-hydroxyacid dehydrogenase